MNSREMPEMERKDIGLNTNTQSGKLKCIRLFVKLTRKSRTMKTEMGIITGKIISDFNQITHYIHFWFLAV